MRKLAGSFTKRRQFQKKKTKTLWHVFNCFFLVLNSTEMNYHDNKI